MKPLDPALTTIPGLKREVERLYLLSIYTRWLLVGSLWLTVGSWSLWQLRAEVSLWLDYFTWSALRYGLAYHRWPALGLGLCIGLTLAILVRQSRHLLFGLPQAEQTRLLHRVLQIRQQGASHPLWHWVCRK